MTHPAQDSEHNQLLRDMNDKLLTSLVRQQELAEKAQHAEAKMEVMVAELQHRTRNLIAVVSAIANRTMERTGPTEAFRIRFNERLQALSRVQGLLSRTDIEPISIGTLVRLELDALGADASEERVTVVGPRVVLRDSTVQTMALAIHELATNARKYGALAADDRTLKVTWDVEQVDSARSNLIFEWVEEGPHRPLGREDALRVGYGRELIERALPYMLNTKTNFELNDEGVRCMIVLPLADRKRSGDSE